MTLEDILEEIVGEFTSNLAVDDIQPLPDGRRYRIDGSATIRDINKVFALVTAARWTENTQWFAIRAFGIISRWRGMYANRAVSV